MTNYAGHWRPQSMAEAQWHIDTGHEGEMFWQWGRDRAAEMRPFFPPLDMDTAVVVDYGCGVGRVLRYMPGAVRVGFDVSAEMLAYAKDSAPDCVFMRTDGRSITLGDESTAFCYSLLTLQHMDAYDVLAVVKDVYRILRPGGMCYLQFSGFGMRRYEPGAVVDRGDTHWNGARTGAVHGAHGALCYSSQDVRDIAEIAGFERYFVNRQDADPTRAYFVLWGHK